MFVGAEILEESRDELVIQCISGYDDLPAPKVIARMSLIAKLMLRDALSRYAVEMLLCQRKSSSEMKKSTGSTCSLFGN